MTTLNTFNDKDLLRNIRTNVLNPMVEQTNSNTTEVSTLKGRVSGVDKRLGLLEPEVGRNTTNLSALNQLAQSVAQQVNRAYDQATADIGNKQVIFTTFGGIESVLNLEPMFHESIRTTIGIKGPNETNYHEVSRLDLEGNAKITYDTPTVGSETATITIEPMKGKINGGSSHIISEVEIRGNVGGSTLANQKLTIDIPKGGSGSNSMFMDPNPPESGKNLFVGTTKEQAQAARDTYFSGAASDLETYNSNIFKIILIEWDNGASTSGDKLLQFQCRHSGSWVNPFHIDFSSFAIGKHNISELKDGNRVSILESETINSVISEGTTGTDIFEVESGRKLKLKKLKAENIDDLTIFSSGTKEVSFRTNPHWRGYYASTSEASQNIQSQDRVANKTTIITQNAQTQDSLHVWDGTNWAEKKISEHGLIKPDGKNWETLKGLKPGTHITFTADSEGYHTVEALSPVIGKVSTGSDQRINRLEVSNNFATLIDGTLRLPVISAMDENSSEMGQIKNIKQGDNVTFEYDNSTGVVTIQSAVTPPIKVSRGAGGLDKNLTKIIDPTSLTKLSDDGELTLHGIDLVNRSGGTLGYVKSLKAGSNITLARDSDGILTIESAGGGGGGGSDVKVATGESGIAVTLTKIIDPSIFSKVDSDGVLTLHSIDSVGTGGGSQGQIKSFKSGDNITFNLDSEGVLQIDSFGGGGGTGGSIQAQVDGGTNYQEISKIEALKSPATIANGILKLNPVIYQKENKSEVGAEGVKIIRAGSGIGIADDEEDDNVIVISNEGVLKCKITTGDSSTAVKQLEQFNLKADPNSYEWITGTYGSILSIDTRGYSAVASTFEELQKDFPIESNAYRQGHTSDNKDVYFAYAGEWKLSNYYGMADQVKSLNARFPVTTSTSPGTYDVGDPFNKIYYVTKANCPVPGTEYKEYGIVKDIVADRVKRSQMFYGLETGNTWYRIMKPTTVTGEDSEFLEWNLLNGLSEDYYSILSIPSLKISDNKNEINGKGYLPWMVMQDPRCNVSVDGANTKEFHINKSGKYDITACIHITASADNPPDTGATYTITLLDTSTSSTGVVVNTKVVTGVKVPKSPAYNAGMYPPVRVTFNNVSATPANKYSIRVTMSRFSNITNGYLDSFKNYLVVQPTSSNTKQGVVIADNWRTALGGFSGKDGYEIHVEGFSPNSSSVRVYGTVLNTKLHI